MRTMLKSKVHRATVTEANVDYEGSVTIDPVLLKAADILPYEQVHILDVDTGARLTTYAIEGRPDSGQVIINGAAARLVRKGDRVIILSYQLMESLEARQIKPRIVFVDEHNAVVDAGARPRAASGS